MNILAADSYIKYYMIPWSTWTFVIQIWVWLSLEIQNGPMPKTPIWFWKKLWKRFPFDKRLFWNYPSNCSPACPVPHITTFRCKKEMKNINCQYYWTICGKYTINTDIKSLPHITNFRCKKELKKNICWTICGKCTYACPT